MRGEINCIFTKVLIPFVEQQVGPEGVAALLRTAGRSRDYLVADHNWIPVALANELARLAQEMMREPDDERWARRYADYLMDWKPSREERSYLGAYGVGLAEPRAFCDRYAVIFERIAGIVKPEVLSVGRRRAHLRLTPLPGFSIPRWLHAWFKVSVERAPTNWNLPRAQIAEDRCALEGADSCSLHVRWRIPPFGARFWGAVAAGALGSALLGLGLAATVQVWWPVQAFLVTFPSLAGIAAGYGLRERERRRYTQQLLDLQSEEIIYSNDQLEKKFRDLETKIEQLSVLVDLSGAVNATLDPEKIYEQALHRLVYQMGYQGAHLWLVDAERQRLSGHRMAGVTTAPGVDFEGLEFPLEDGPGVVVKVALTGLPIVVNDVESATEPVHLPTARLLNTRALVAVPLRVKERIFGVLTIVSSDPDRFKETDVELLGAVANHVALAVDRAESFQTIEELSRDLEDKVRVRTEQLRAANEDLQAAYRDLQATQMQLIQREKMASVGQLVAGVAHELNNPIGFVFSNVTTLEDFVQRLRSIVVAYRGVELPEVERTRIQEQWEALKIDYALKYLDSMIQGIREGAERTRKIVRDLRVFSRNQDDVWQAVDLHEDLESSLTLLNHLLKDRVAVHRKFGELPPVECIRSQIDQVFLNLLANAAQAIIGEGAVTVETRFEAGMAVVAIHDTGPGIPRDVVHRIFDPFFTTKPVGEGTGLGLSISYEIIKKHAGEIHAESRPGGGATFTVRIPLTRASVLS